jgi:transcriptional regulator with AAA-type ATPase domain
LLAKEPRARPPSAESLIRSLAPLIPGLPPEAPGREGRHLVTAAFVGRESELAELERRLDPAIRGEESPAGFAVIGDVGVGKTRLLREFTLSARIKGTQVIESACSPHRRGLLEPLAEWLRPLEGRIDSLDASLRGPLQRWLLSRGRDEDQEGAAVQFPRLVQGLKSLFHEASEQTPLLFVLEDLHRADVPLLRAIGTLFEGEPKGRWAILLAGRDRFDDPGVEKGFASLREREVISVMELSPFTAREVAQWVAAALPGATLPAPRASEIRQWAGGNPFLIREAVLAGLEEGRFTPTPEGWRFRPPRGVETFPPAGVQTERRFKILAAEEKALVKILALHPGPLRLDQIARVLGHEDAPAIFPPLRQLVRLGWAVEDRVGPAFTLFHDRMRRPVMREMTSKERRDGHHRLAETLRPLVPEDEALEALVAEHWLRAGRHGEAAEACLGVGRCLEKRWFPGPARRFLGMAKYAAARAGWDEAAVSDIEISLAYNIQKIGHPRRAIRMFQELLKRPLPQALLGRCSYNYAFALKTLGRFEEALSAYRESRRLAEASGDRENLGPVLLGITFILNRMDRFEEVLEISETLEPLCEGHPHWQIDNYYTRVRAFFSLGRIDEAFAQTKNALQASRKVDPSTPAVPQSFYMMGFVRYLQGRARKSLRWCQAARKRYALLGHPLSTAGVESMMVELLWGMGRTEEAGDILRHAMRTLKGIGGPQVRMITIDNEVDEGMNCGRYSRVLRMIRETEAWLSRQKEDHRGIRMRNTTAFIRFLIRAGGNQEALEAFEKIRPDIAKVDTLARHGTWITEMGCQRINGRPEKALEIMTRLEEEPYRVPMLMTGALPEKARALAALGRHEEAGEALRRVEEEIRGMGYPAFLLEPQLHGASLALETGDWEGALSAAGLVQEDAARMGMIYLVWEALYVAGLALERMGRARRAEKFFRRAAWAVERELASFPEPHRTSFRQKARVSDLLNRAGALRTEDTALRLAGRLGRRFEGPEGDWAKTALAWAQAVHRALGADAMVFEARWAQAMPPQAVFGEPQESDETVRFDFGSEGERAGSVTIFRRWVLGPFLPMSKRIGRILADRLASGLEREERRALAGRFERFKRTQSDAMKRTKAALSSVRRTLSQTQLALGAARGYGEMVGDSKGMRKVYDLVQRWGPEDATVLVTGESGTGKELVARAIHTSSKRREGPFFAVNCGAMAESLLGSEIFGHEKGAFTGADETRPGLFELAVGGTLVLDEVAEMTLTMQAQLLRVLDGKTVRRLGATSDLPVDVRVIALTNRTLQEEVVAGRFRADLFHRLNAASIEVPPLRKRKEDIPLLAQYFLSEFRGKGMRSELPRGVSSLLMKHRWPGNVRELRNEMQRVSVLARGRELQPDDFQELDPAQVTKTSLSERLLVKLRESAARGGIDLESRHEDLFRILAGGGVIRRGEYEQLAGISSRTANRDFKRFESLGMIQRIGRGRASSYQLDPALQELT